MVGDSMLPQLELPTDDVTFQSMGQTSVVREHSHIPLLQHTQPWTGWRQTSEWAEPQGAAAEGTREK